MAGQDGRDHNEHREHPDQAMLIDTSVRSLNPYWVDPTQPLLVPVNPDHFEAHKLQMLLQRLDKQAEHKPAQFSSVNYIAVLEKFTAICKQINRGEAAAADNDDENLDTRGMAEGGYAGAAARNRTLEPISMDS